MWTPWHTTELANLAVGLVFSLFTGVCAVLCFVHRRLSSRLMLLGAGFLLQCIVGLVTRLGVFALTYFERIGAFGGPLSPGLKEFFIIMPVGGYILAFTLIVVGLSLSLGDIARRMRRLEYEPGEPRSRIGAEEAREARQPRKEGSHDIQQ